MTDTEYWRIQTLIPSRHEAEDIKRHFGLATIFHYAENIPKDEVLVLPLFDNERAVYHKARERDPFRYSSPSPGHHIELTINITRPMDQIKGHVQWEVEWARKNLEMKDQKFKPNYDVFKVLDSLQRGEAPTEIIGAVWPVEYQKSKGQDEDSLKKQYKELAKKYRLAGIEHWDERAYDETHEKSEGRHKLYVRVGDYKKRMTAYLGKFGGY
jgi:hypothetical protein